MERQVVTTPIVTLDDVKTCPLTREERDLVVDGVVHVFRIDIADISIFKRVLAPSRPLRIAEAS
jgi:hypothetical protein